MILEFIKNNLTLLFVISYLITVILNGDLIYWMYQQEFVHWKKKKNYIRVREKAIRKEFWNEKKAWRLILVGFIPLLNTIWYLLLMKDAFKCSFEFSNNYVIQDLCNWKKGIHAYIFKWWKPSEKWNKKYDVE